MVYLAVALSAALGGFVQSITGFGAAVVMMTILPYFFTMAVAPSVSTSICLGLTVTLAWKLRNHNNGFALIIHSFKNIHNFIT